MAGSIDKLGKNSEQLAKYAGLLIDNFHSMTSTLRFMGKAFEEMYLVTEDSPPEEIQQLIKIAEEIDERAVKPFQQSMSKGFIEPANEYHALFAPMKDKHAQRKKILLEYDYYKDKVKSLTENKKASAGTELPRMKEKMQTYEEQYETITNVNKNEMRDLMDSRPGSLDPMARLLLKDLLEYSRKMTEVMEKVYGTSAIASKTTVVTKPGASVRNVTSSFGNMSFQRSREDSQAQPMREVPPQYAGEWYYLDSGLKQQGPVTFMDLATKLKTGELSGDSHIFGGSLSEWRKINDEADINRSLRALF